MRHSGERERERIESGGEGRGSEQLRDIQRRMSGHRRRGCISAAAATDSL